MDIARIVFFLYLRGEVETTKRENTDTPCLELRLGRDRQTLDDGRVGSASAWYGERDMAVNTHVYIYIHRSRDMCI